jgi:hypothetical protein
MGYSQITGQVKGPTTAIPTTTATALLRPDQNLNQEREQGGSFNESGHNQRGTLNLAGRFRLAGDGFHGRRTDFANSESGTEGEHSRTDSRTEKVKVEDSRLHFRDTPIEWFIEDS